jgi:hypothetical protein
MVKHTVVDGITVYDVCDVILDIYPNWYTDKLYATVDYSERQAQVLSWARANHCSMYSDDRERFLISRGVFQAIEEGNSGVIVEDLS